MTAPQDHDLELEQLTIVEADGTLRPEPPVVYIDHNHDRPLTADAARRLGQQLLLAAEILDGRR